MENKKKTIKILAIAAMCLLAIVVIGTIVQNWFTTSSAFTKMKRDAIEQLAEKKYNMIQADRKLWEEQLGLSHDKNLELENEAIKSLKAKDTNWDRNVAEKLKLETKLKETPEEFTSMDQDRLSELDEILTISLLHEKERIYKTYGSQAPVKSASDSSSIPDNSIVEPEIGMTKAQVEKSTWGKPYDISTTRTAYGDMEYWHYKGERIIVFYNGMVQSISE